MDSEGPVGKALAYMHRSFRDPLTLEDAANYAGVSANYLSNLFSKRVGVPFQTYLQRLRLSFAYELLRTTRLPITEIRKLSGFGHLSHFERAFKREYGVTPRQTRNDAARTPLSPP